MSAKKLVAGKHNCVGLFSGAAEVTDTSPDFLDRPCMLVYVGTFDSMDGEVEVTEDHINLLVLNHNARLTRVQAIAGTEDVLCRMMQPLQLDHSTSAVVTVGRVIGKMFKGTHVLDDGASVPALYCEKVRTLGSENVPKVKDGRWANVSIGADLEMGILNELSITPFPAAPNATLLKAAKPATAKLSEGEKTMDKEKLKKHLVEKEKLSEKDADEKLAKMSDDEKKELSAKVDEDEKKMAKKLAEDEEEEKKDKEKKMTAAKANIVSLSKGFTKNAKEVKLAARKTMVSAKISRLRAAAKVTPAEIKKMDMSKLAALDDTSLSAVLKTYEDREPVIDTSFHGTAKAVNLAKLQKDINSAKLRAEAKSDLGIKLSAEDEKALAGEPVSSNDPNPKSPEQMSAEHEDHLRALGAMLEGYNQRDTVMGHVKKMMDHYKSMAAAPGEVSEEDEKQMSALAENVNRLQTEFQAVMKEVALATGISSADLSE
jgi:hypothetical protein